MLPVMRFKIEDRSMEPALAQGDYVLVNRLAYVFKKPYARDLIVFRHPEEKNKFLVKRIESVVSSNKYFVVGDNRKYSKDSRHFGAIGRELIVGKVWIYVKQ